MSSDQTWVEALNISPESLTEWSTQVPPDMPLLVWCMTNGHVKAEDYLAWACDHFGLAVLDSKFFSESFQRETLQPVRDKWSAWCFPIGSWDDCTFVACAEPPHEPAEGGFAYILADPNAMKAAWGETDENADAMLEAPAGINPNATRTFILNFDETTVMIHSDGVDPHQKDDDKTEVTLSVVGDAKTAVKPTLKAAPPAPATKAAVNEDTPPPAPAPRAKPTLISAATANEESEIANAFERLRGSYQSSLIMRCADGAARPYKWDSTLPIVANDEKFTVNLNYPSFFRIVAKTMHPYHGYVIESPVHKQFFANLNFENPPACVTAIPLRTGDNLWGLLVAFGGQPAQTTDALNEALGVAEKLTAVMSPTWAKSA